MFHGFCAALILFLAVMAIDQSMALSEYLSVCPAFKRFSDLNKYF